MHFNVVLTLKKTLANMLEQQRRQKGEMNFSREGNSVGCESVCLRERESECLCVRESEEDNVCVWFVLVTERDKVCISVCVCVCVCLLQREIESVCVRVCVCVLEYVCL